MSYIEKFEEIKIPIFAAAEFPIDFLAPRITQKRPYSIVIEKLCEGMFATHVIENVDYVDVPMFEINDEKDIERCAELLYTYFEFLTKDKCLHNMLDSFVMPVRQNERGFAILGILEGKEPAEFIQPETSV